MRSSIVISLALCGLLAQAQGAEPAKAPPAATTADSRAVMTSEQVVQLLDETVDWYRTLGTQQQAAGQPSDLLILYANRQTADKVMALAFEIARANAELLSSEADVAKAKEEEDSEQSLTRMRRKLEAQRASLQAEIDAEKKALAAAAKPARAGHEARIAVLQGEFDLINARRNLLGNMSQFAGENDANGFGANALKAHIDAIAASVPSLNLGGTPVTATTATTSATTTLTSTPSSTTSAAVSESGIWDLAGAVFRLRGKASTIESIDRRTAELQEMFTRIRTPPEERLKALAARGDALSSQADATNANLRGVRDQYDTIAWLFQQTAAMVTPLSKVEVLLNQYRRNLDNWSDATERQYREALSALGLRLAVFAGLLAAVWVFAEVWRRAAFRYIKEGRRRSRVLLLRKIMLWTLVAAIVIFTFATEVSSLATFAGLITAGLAVAMQSVLVSVVGYFFLIGKYGVRVGDRVQIGSVTGEVVDLGLVRLHLMELRGDDAKSPTGRVVAFANSVVFQASGGLFKQLPGINLAWHEITVALPAESDHAALKAKLLDVTGKVLDDYRDDIVQQTQVIQQAAATDVIEDVQPQVQLRFAASGVDATVRYPVLLAHAAEIDERVSREVHAVVSAEDASG